MCGLGPARWDPWLVLPGCLLLAALIGLIGRACYALDEWARRDG